jgi:hypothetical protein
MPIQPSPDQVRESEGPQLLGPASPEDRPAS